MIACKIPSALFWNIGSLGHNRNVRIVTSTLEKILDSSPPEVVCFAEASFGSSGFTEIVGTLTKHGYGPEPVVSTDGAKSIAMFFLAAHVSLPITLTRDAIVAIRVNQLWYLGFHFPRCSKKKDQFRQDFQKLHDTEIKGPAIAIGDFNAQKGYLDFASYYRLKLHNGDQYTYCSGGDNPRRSTIDAVFVRERSHSGLIVSHDVKSWWMSGAGKWKKKRLDHSYVLVSPG